ncbi:branched-chain amino acid ABC transporter substrate-binding protein [Achromobacter sp. K91]|jgi:branched-chain amino acid transport system substrate-binding protein|uniref:Leu/Ile/Val/Thr-binding protein n=1 Tax=Achromobacter aegrifaciens TaxID=1287736 RepID=A0AAD2IXS0_ACHAE|nr:MULTISPECIES: ABC transporter substrate-binding protein [Achromobacter]MBD9420550.1 ABC transporter substrate-binding protein [Achromobacter sp. ACM04]RIJ03103.1 branched-chain amino acid ABC transporter substrate-binding protein [Achromobacter sp. K91]RSF09113.1 branched-chain amino acid ABC transporter substrate-binding protein [Achromobacter aegrifaciens]CUI79917.1 Leu/Ile/Val/Thr-binding protein precursor [Achromobacter aegrifaciens]
MKTSRLAALLGATLLSGAAALASAADKPKELNIGISTYLSGSASVFGVPARDAAEILIQDINANGGIDGVKLVPSYIDEGGGGEKLLSEYRRLAEGGTRVMLSAISSGHCNIVAPVAEDLKVLNVLWDCGTEKALEGKKYKYVVRTQANATTEMVAQVLYLMKVKPDFKTIAIVNQDYAWGRDSRDIFLAALKKFKPDVKVVAEMFPKFGAADFSTEISRLQALRPDVIVSTSWGGDLDNFVRQASQRNLFKNSTFVLSLAESSLERLGNALPEGVYVGARGDHYFLHPETKDDPQHQAFVKKFHDKTGAYPIYSVYHMVQAIQGLKAGYEKAIKDNAGAWPSPEQVAAAMHDVTFKGYGREVKMQRADGQGLEAQLFGVTKKSDKYPFKVLADITIVPAELVTPGVSDTSMEWIDKSLTPDVLKSDQIKVYSN